MYKIITRFSDNNSDEIILNKARNGLLKYTEIACDHDFDLNFLLTDEQILLLVSRKISIIFEGNKKRIIISQIMKMDCAQYFHFAYLNDIFTPEDSEEIKEALKGIYLDFYLHNCACYVESVFQVRNKVMRFDPKIIEMRRTHYNDKSIGEINVFPDGSMKVYEFLRGRYDKFDIRLYVSYGTPEESIEVQRILESYDKFGDPYELSFRYDVDLYNASDIFDRDRYDYIKTYVSIFPELPTSKVYTSFFEYIDRIKNGLYYSKFQNDIIIVAQN